MTIPDLERQIEQAENQIALLMGEEPGPIRRAKWQAAQALPPGIPAGLPSTLIDRRPDIRAADQSLVAANANVGVAKTLFFPQIALIAPGGFEAAELAKLFDGPSGWFSLAAGLVATVFNAGRLRANLQGAEARREQAVLGYQFTVQSTFREVADTLVGYRKTVRRGCSGRGLSQRSRRTPRYRRFDQVCKALGGGWQTEVYGGPSGDAPGVR